MSRRALSQDEMLMVLADCQRILKNPERANDLIRYVALSFKPQSAAIPSEVKRLKSVQRAEKLGISIRFVRDAPPRGELRRNAYEHVFVYRSISGTAKAGRVRAMSVPCHRPVHGRYGEGSDKVDKG